MHTPSAQPSDEPRASIRIDARLDATTREKVDDLAQHFHQPRAAVLCHIMHWGLSYEQPGPLDQHESQGPVRHLYLCVPSELRDGVEKAATAAGVKTASWLRHMVRQITITDFPASWQEATPCERSHDSRTYGRRFMLRLDDSTRETLEAWSTHFERSAAEIIRQLLAQATSDMFPVSWHLRVAERHRAQTRPGRRDADDEG
jgi:predicted DNA-binding protein